MPQNASLKVAASPVLLTDANVTALRIQNTGVHRMKILAVFANPAPAAPTNWAGAITLQPGEMILADKTLAQLFPGVASANRVYAIAEGITEASVSHA